MANGLANPIQAAAAHGTLETGPNPVSEVQDIEDMLTDLGEGAGAAASSAMPPPAASAGATAVRPPPAPSGFS